VLSRLPGSGTERRRRLLAVLPVSALSQKTSIRCLSGERFIGKIYFGLFLGIRLSLLSYGGTELSYGGTEEMT
jgi:hypothetical protein